MKTKELKNTEQNVKNEDSLNSNYELVRRTEIKDTPFTVITTEEGSFIVMGKYRLTEPFKTEEEAMDEGEKMTWNRIVQVVMLLWEQVNDKPKTTK